MTIIGFIGTLCLGLCGLPQLIHTLKTRKADDISWYFLLLWLVGEILLTIYQYHLNGLTLIHLNYTMNIVIILVIMRFK